MFQKFDILDNFYFLKIVSTQFWLVINSTDDAPTNIRKPAMIFIGEEDDI